MDIKEELWKLAVLVAMARLGILPMLRDEDGAWLPPTPDVAADPAGTRSARRKYRKLWRQNLARELREFNALPPRRQKRYAHCGATVKGRYRTCDDPLGVQLLKIASYDAGRRPRKGARGRRWDIVKSCPQFRRVLLQVAEEFGLLDPKRNM